MSPISPPIILEIHQWLLLTPSFPPFRDLHFLFTKTCIPASWRTPFQSHKLPIHASCKPQSSLIESSFRSSRDPFTPHSDLCHTHQSLIFICAPSPTCECLLYIESYNSSRNAVILSHGVRVRENKQTLNLKNYLITRCDSGFKVVQLGNKEELGCGSV